MRRQSNQGLLLASLVDSRDVRQTIACDVVCKHCVHQGNKEVLAVLGATIAEVGAERVQDLQVVVSRVKQRLAENGDGQAQQGNAVLVVLVDVVIGGSGHGDTVAPDEVLIDAKAVGTLAVREWLDGKAFLEV